MGWETRPGHVIVREARPSPAILRLSGGNHNCEKLNTEKVQFDKNNCLGPQEELSDPDNGSLVILQFQQTFVRIIPPCLFQVMPFVLAFVEVMQVLKMHECRKQTRSLCNPIL